MPITHVIEPRRAQIADDIFVTRILPFREKRLLGPFCFLDHMGPAHMKPNGQSDVLPHPHIGLSTLTYLFKGEMVHRDSLGVVQNIRAGEVNWMTAGRGVVHSERAPDDVIARHPEMEGLQAWVALPSQLEDCDPSFQHYDRDQIPTIEESGLNVQLIAGSMKGKTSPVKTSSPLTYAKVEMQAGARLTLESGDQELGFYLIRGSVECDGQSFNGEKLVIFAPGSRMEIQSKDATLGAILGGVPLPEKRVMFWNFVATTQEKLDEAKLRWKEQRFDRIPGETEFVPLPE